MDLKNREMACGKEEERMRDKQEGAVPMAGTPAWGRYSVRSYGMNDIHWARGP